MRNWEGCIQARAALYLPGGRIAKELSRNPTVLVVNDTAFAHGGLLPTHGEHTGRGGTLGNSCRARSCAGWVCLPLPHQVAIQYGAGTLCLCKQQQGCWGRK